MFMTWWLFSPLAMIHVVLTQTSTRLKCLGVLQYLAERAKPSYAEDRVQLRPNCMVKKYAPFWHRCHHTSVRDFCPSSISALPNVLPLAKIRRPAPARFSFGTASRGRCPGRPRVFFGVKGTTSTSGRGERFSRYSSGARDAGNEMWNDPYFDHPTGFL